MPTNSKNQEMKDRALRAAEKKTLSLQDRLDDIYKQIYSTDTMAKQQSERIGDEVTSSINNILSSNSDIQGLPDVSQLYARVLKKNGEFRKDTIVNGLMDIMSNDTLMNTLVADPEINRYIRQKDLQIDMILKYMPKLKEALNAYTDKFLQQKKSAN